MEGGEDRLERSLGLAKVCGLGLFVSIDAQRAEARRDAAALGEARVRVGPLDKTVRVIGDRRWDAHGVASAPAPFTEMPLRYTHAFGGAGFPLNPYGKGFSDDATAPLEGRALPNLEDPAMPIGAWSDSPVPAAWGPVPRSITVATRLPCTAPVTREHVPSLPLTSHA